MSPTTLEQDLARVAALRGRPPADYVDADAALRRQRAAEALSPARIAGLFLAIADPAFDLRFYDRLPPASRAFLRDETEVHVCALKWAEALEACGDERALLAAVRRHLTENLPYHAKHAYGPAHPAAKGAT